jgi:hypothetical protein
MCRIIVLTNFCQGKPERCRETNFTAENVQQKKHGGIHTECKQTNRLQAEKKTQGQRHKSTIINVEQAQIQRGRWAYINMFMRTMCRQIRDINEKTIIYENKHKHTAPPVRRLTN